MTMLTGKSLSLPVMPRVPTNERSRLLMVGPYTGRCHRRSLLLRVAP
jgi:hypothetical protein